MDNSEPSRLRVSPLLNSSHFVVLGLFTRVTNAPVVRERLVDGTLKAAVIDCRLILDPFQVLVAANKAWQSSQNGTMKTKTVFSEVLYNLSTSGNISDCFKKFGLTDKSQNMLVVTFEKSEELFEFPHVKETVEGVLSPLEDLKRYHIVKDIKNYYKITDEECATSNVLDCIVTRLATKDFC